MTTVLENIKYRASNGEDFMFDFELRDDGWRVYITSQPRYRHRSASAHDTHRLGRAERPYICWTDPINGLDDAFGVAALWAEATLVYIATGRFNAPRRLPRLHDLTGLTRLSR
ncbi:MAG: hypothetical protein OXG52_07355 [bacterium]|nr:hypothetical protein [bacterium]